jgi:hypothetical protein
MSDVIINAKVGVSGVNNGAVVVFAQETGTYNRFDPDINSFTASGTMFTRLNERFDEHYGGGGATSRFPQTLPATIASGAAISSIIDTYAGTLMGIHFPSTFTGASVTFQASDTLNGTYRTVNQFDSSADYSVTVSPTEYQPVDFNVFAGVRYLKIISASNEAAARTLTVSLRTV